MSMKKIFVGLLCLLCVIANTPIKAKSSSERKSEVDQQKMRKEVDRNLRLWYEKPANINSPGGSGQSWERETLPIGNGDLGGLIFGGISKDRIHFNEKSLWTGGPSTSRPTYDGGNRDKNVTASELETYRLQLDNKSSSVFNRGMENNLFAGDTNGMGAYQDFGDIYLDFAPSGIKDSQAKNYVRDLDLNTAIATSSYDANNVHYEREYFTNTPDNVMVIRLHSDQKGALSFDANMQLNNGNLAGTSTLNEKQNTFAINGTVKDNSLAFHSSMKIIPTNGEISVDQNTKKFMVRNADEVIILMSADTNYKNAYPTYRDADKNVANVVTERLNAAAEKGYENLKNAHLEDYQKLFQRVSFSLGEQAPAIPTDELLHQYQKGEYSTYLETLMFQYGRYLTIASSRGKLPSNLCGLWTIGNPAWSGDFHFNVNVQMNYWPVYATNLAECGTTFVDYMDSLREPGRVSAARSHGVISEGQEANGFVVHTQNNPFGMTAPSAEQEYGWNVTGSAWAMQNAYDYYRFTKDKTYLKEKIYPMMKEVANFWDEYLWYSPYQKRLVVSPSFSAEHGPTANGTTYDQSLVWQLYQETIEAAQTLGIDQDLVAIWKDKQAQLKPIMIGTDGEVKEWFEQTTYGKAQAGSLAEISIPNFYAGNAGEHRHSSHLIGLYPGTLINKDNEEYMDAAKVSLLQRGFEATGWSKAHKINMWARTGDASNTLKLIRSMISGGNTGILENLLDSHGGGANNKDYSIFQIDGNFGLTSGISEMLLQSQLGYTQFLPALPTEWKNGNIQGLVARGNFTIGQEWKNGLASTFTLTYTGEDASAPFIGEYAGIKNAKVYKNGQPITFTKDEEHDRIQFIVEKGATYTIDMSTLYENELREVATKILASLHPDVIKIKEELTNAIAGNDMNQLSTVIQKAQAADDLYREVLPYTNSVYQLTNDKALTKPTIDGVYKNIIGVKTMMLENSGSYEDYQLQKSNIQADKQIIDKELATNVLSFSKDSGVIDPNDHTLTLSKHEDAADYTIRYVVDELDNISVPTAASTEYTKAITLPIDKNTTIRAALFKGKQQVSAIFTKKYLVNQIDITKAETPSNDWGSIYSVDKAIDQKTNTRWATKAPTKPCEITLSFADYKTIDTLRFDQFVSTHNSIDEFEIQYEVDGKFQSAYHGTKLGSMDDKVGNIIPGDDGYHAIKSFSFSPITTKKVKVIFKTFVGEPSFFEITPFLFADTAAYPAGDSSLLMAAIEKAKAIDTSDPIYVNAHDDLKKAFALAIRDGERAKSASQDHINMRLFYLEDCLNRLGFGISDKSELVKIIQEATEKLDGKYDKDSLYYLQKGITQANVVNKDEHAKQSDINRAIDELRKIINNLVGLEETTEPLPLNSGQGPWLIVPSGEPNVGNYYTTKENEAMTYTFSGTGIKVTGVVADDHGIMEFRLVNPDGTDMSYVVDCYHTTRLSDAILFEENELPNQKYTLIIKHVGKNPAAKNQYVEYKNIQVTTSGEEKEVDKTELQTLIKACDKLNEKDYTSESFAAFHATLTLAKKVAASDTTCNAEIKDTIADLNAAKKALVKVNHDVNTAHLTALLNDAKDIDAEGYTSESFEKLQRKITEIEAFLQGVMTQAEVDQKQAELQFVVDSLIVDKTALKEAFAAANLLKQEDYTKDSWTSFAAKRTAAKNVIDKEKATLADVANALHALQEAQKNLQPIEKPGVVNKDVLRYILGIAIDAKEAEGYNHDHPSWEKFVTAYDQAVIVDRNTKATQAEVNDATKALSKAYENIRLLPNEELLQTLIDYIAQAKNLKENQYRAQDYQFIMKTAEKAKKMLDEKIYNAQELTVLLQDIDIAKHKITDPLTKEETDAITQNPEVQVIPDRKNGIHTGDSTNIGLLIGLIGLSSFFLVMGKRKKKSLRK